MMPRARSALYVASCSSSLKVRSDGGTAGLQELCEVGWCDVAFPDVFEQVHARVGVTAVGELAADHVPGPPNPPAESRDGQPERGGGQCEVVEEAVVDLGGGVAVRCVDDGCPLRAGERDDAGRPEFACVTRERPYAGTCRFGLHDLPAADVDERVLVFAEPGAVEAFTPCDEPAGEAACRDDREIAGLRGGHRTDSGCSACAQASMSWKQSSHTTASPPGCGCHVAACSARASASVQPLMKVSPQLSHRNSRLFMAGYRPFLDDQLAERLFAVEGVSAQRGVAVAGVDGDDVGCDHAGVTHQPHHSQRLRRGHETPFPSRYSPGLRPPSLSSRSPGSASMITNPLTVGVRVRRTPGAAPSVTTASRSHALTRVIHSPTLMP